MINAAEEKRENIINILKMVNTVFKSPTKKSRNKIEKFYIANSEDFIKYIKNNNLYFLYDGDLINEKTNIFEKINYNDLSGYQQELFNKYKKSRDIIIDFSNKEYEKAKQEEEEKQKNKRNNSKKNIEEENKIEIKTTGSSGNLDINNEINQSNNYSINSLEYKFKPNEFLISVSNFKLNNEDLTYEEDEDFLEFDKEEQKENLIIDPMKIEEKPSDIYNENNIFDNYIKINKTIKDVNFISYHSTINFIEHLCDISNDLPNYPIEEQMLYLYKKLNQINQILPCNTYLPFLKDSTRNYLIVHIPLEGARIFRTKTRCPLMLTFEIVRIDEINEVLKEEQENGLHINIERNKSIVSQTTLINTNSNILLKDKIVSKDLEESKEIYTGTDYDLSKPVILNKKQAKKIDEEKNKTNKMQEMTITSHTQVKKKKAKNAESIEEQRIKNIINKFKQINPLEIDKLIEVKILKQFLNQSRQKLFWKVR